MSNSIVEKLTHSNAAISVTHQFYDKTVMIYVEGDNDISFWNERFNKKMPSDFYEITHVQGKENLSQYINGILDGSLKNIIVACDSDYNRFKGNNPYDNPCIITTYGHSIENTMFCPTYIATYIRQLSNTTINYSDEIKQWYDNFCKDAKLLLPYDIATNIDDCINTKKTKVFNMGFDYFRKNDEPSILDISKIDNYINQIKSSFNNHNIQKIEKQIKINQIDTRYILQGHFVANAVNNFIRQKFKSIKKRSVTISNDVLYAAFVNCCEMSCSSECQDKKFINDQIHKVLNFYNLQN